LALRFLAGDDSARKHLAKLFLGGCVFSINIIIVAALSDEF
jgi:hypothetical protein